MIKIEMKKKKKIMRKKDYYLCSKKIDQNCLSNYWFVIHFDKCKC